MRSGGGDLSTTKDSSDADSGFCLIYSRIVSQHLPFFPRLPSLSMQSYSTLGHQSLNGTYLQHFLVILVLLLSLLPSSPVAYSFTPPLGSHRSMHTQCALLPFLFSFDPKAAVMALDKGKEAEKK